MEFPAAHLTGGGDLPVLIAFVTRIDIDGDDREVDRRALPEHVEDLDERNCFAARQADHDPVAVFNQVEVDNRLGGLLGDPRLERTTMPHPPIILSPSVIIGEEGRRLALVSALYAGLTFVMAYPFSASPRSLVLADAPDTHLFLWTLAWDVYAFIHQPILIFDANIYHPYPNTLAYSGKPDR